MCFYLFTYSFIVKIHQCTKATGSGSHFQRMLPTKRFNMETEPQVCFREVPQQRDIADSGLVMLIPW